MQRLLASIILVLFFTTSVFAAKVYQDSPGEFYIDFGDLKEIVINIKNQKLKIHKCGKVEKMEWKEVIPNQDNTVLFYNGSPNWEITPNSIQIIH